MSDFFKLAEDNEMLAIQCEVSYNVKMQVG